NPDMMRKDVKLGFAIGGVLLAVLVVYALVGMGNNGAEHGGAGIVTEDASGAASADASKNSSKHDAAKVEEVSPLAATTTTGHDAIASAPPTTAPSEATARAPQSSSTGSN